MSTTDEKQLRRLIRFLKTMPPAPPGICLVPGGVTFRSYPRHHPETFARLRVCLPRLARSGWGRKVERTRWRG